MLTIDFNSFSLSSADDELLHAADVAIAMHRAAQPGHARELDAAKHEADLSWRPYFEFLPDDPNRLPDDDGASWAWLRGHYGALGLKGMPFATATAFVVALSLGTYAISSRDAWFGYNRPSGRWEEAVTWQKENMGRWPTCRHPTRRIGPVACIF
jgi:hypothetical protein